MTDDLLRGILIGLALSLALGTAARLLLVALDAIAAFFQPQRVALPMQTRRTPFQVLCGCLLAATALGSAIYLFWVLAQRLF
jgi:hypothetical protein